MALHKRLLQDIAELRQRPYPNIEYTPYFDDITKACLVLTPDGYSPLHLTVSFTDQYPLRAPHVTIQSLISHPNIFGNYICASILNTAEGWTPAYTLQGICIQLLSFFGSDKLEQSSGRSVDLTRFKDSFQPRPHVCSKCTFDSSKMSNLTISSPPRPLPPGAEGYTKDTATKKRRKHNRQSSSSNKGSSSKNASVAVAKTHRIANTGLFTLPDEILVLICSFLETEELVPFSRAWDRVGGERGVINTFNVIRNRELICFCLKNGFEDAQLGVGVHIDKKGRIGSFESEFDLLSLEAFESYNVRRAVQGGSFENWLPLPISRRHYSSIKTLVEHRLQVLAQGARYPSSEPEKVIYGFMSDIVVRLSNTAEKTRASMYGYSRTPSSLTHASEKAIESYFHLFHLLLCLATENPRIVRTVNQTLRSFLDGKTSKAHVPNLGHLLIAVLISDADMTKDLLMAIIHETITRNVVWMLDKRGANMPELAYMEADEISQYRLQKTFDASKTSYRLLMFLNLFRQTINRGTPGATTNGTRPKSLVQLRDELFDAHGAPPAGTATRLANDIKALQQVQNFPQFLTIMGLTPPSGREFTSFLRHTLEDSVRAGYSVWGISQQEALTLRQQVDPNVRERQGHNAAWNSPGTFGVNFFPNSDLARNKKGRIR